MNHILTFKYRIKDGRAAKRLCDMASAANQVWNYCNDYQRNIESKYLAGAPTRKWPSHFDFCKLTSGVSKELCLHSDTVNEVCRFYAKSRDKARRSLRFRTSYGSRRSLGWIPFRSRHLKISGNKIIYLGKTFRVFGTKSRPFPEKLTGGCFVEDARGRWYLCLTAHVETLPRGDGSIGIDLGLKIVATLSDGGVIPALRHFRRYEKALATAQRANNRKRVKAIHAKIANARKDQMHKATTKIARDNKLIVIGNVSAPKLKQTRFGKSVSDAGWGMLKSQLEYKARRHQADFIVVDEAMTSRSCSDCGAVSGPKGIAGLGIRAWECSECGASHDRDVNAARNILRLGLSAQPHADESRRVA